MSEMFLYVYLLKITSIRISILCSRSGEKNLGIANGKLFTPIE